MPDSDDKRGEIRKVDIGAEFRVCPECGYENGFHNVFRPADEKGILLWFFLCPSCSSCFDIGLKVQRE